jgi:tryptophanyl-tRNA synthetase
MNRRRIFSGIQPTGTLHLGNYLGAVQNWVALQNAGDAECIYCIVDYHAITIDYDLHHLASLTVDLARDLFACGLDPEISTVFVQSQVPEHTELAWVFQAACTSYGELQRMTQFKAKAEEQSFVSAGLFTYPALQAADILLYQATHVPVGEDQVQHLELAREISRRFNSRFGNTFPEVRPLLTAAPRIMSLRDPDKKMSKSSGEGHYLSLSATQEEMGKMIQRAVTDVGPLPDGSMGSGVKNLFDILQALDDRGIYDQLMAAYREGHLKYVDLKAAVADAVCRTVGSIQERRLSFSPERVQELLREGADRIRPQAEETMATVRERIGLADL